MWGGWLDGDLHLYILLSEQLTCWVCLTTCPMIVLLSIVHILGPSLGNDRSTSFEFSPYPAFI